MKKFSLSKYHNEIMEHKKKVLLDRLKKGKLDQYLNKDFLIKHLETLLEDRLDFVSEEDDIFEQDSIAILYCIALLEGKDIQEYGRTYKLLADN